MHTDVVCILVRMYTAPNVAIASSIAHCAVMYCFVLSCSNLVCVFCEPTGNVRWTSLLTSLSEVNSYFAIVPQVYSNSYHSTIPC